MKPTDFNSVNAAIRTIEKTRGGWSQWTYDFNDDGTAFVREKTRDEKIQTQRNWRGLWDAADDSARRGE